MKTNFTRHALTFAAGVGRFLFFVCSKNMQNKVQS
jgi:hypothetical protein